MSRKIDADFARLKMIEAGLLPLEPYSNANANWRCKCINCGNEVISRYNRIQQGSGCPKCSAKSAGLKLRLSEEVVFNRLAELNLEPLEKYSKSDEKIKCRCKVCDSIVFPKIKNLTRGDGGCLACGNAKAANKNRKSEIEAEKIVRDLGYLPLEPYKNALTKWKLKHLKCNGEVSPKLNSLINNSDKSAGCAICSGHQVKVGYNDLKTTHPILAAEAYGWDASTVTSGSSTKKFAWKCESGHIWKTTVAQRSDGHGCPTCSQTGFDPNKDGYLYFLKHENWGMLQIGITNKPENRINSHKKLGWELIEIRGPMDGLIAHNWETSILRMLREGGADLANRKIVGKFDGYTEAWSIDKFNVSSLKDLMVLVEKHETINKRT
jgi:hypothetical protein